jgi:CheY-like chemotaxis protein
MKNTFKQSTTYPWAFICPWEFVEESNRKWCDSRKKPFEIKEGLHEAREIYENGLKTPCDLGEFIRILAECKKRTPFQKYSVKTFHHIASIAISWLNNQRANPMHHDFFQTMRAVCDHLASGTSDEYEIIEALWTGQVPPFKKETAMGISLGPGQKNRWRVQNDDEITDAPIHKIVENTHSIEYLGGEPIDFPLNLTPQNLIQHTKDIKKISRIVSGREYFQNYHIEVQHPLSKEILNTKSRNALIVEDDDSQTEYLISVLQDAFPRMEVHWADNIEKAEEILRHNNIDLIIIDEALQEEKASEWLKENSFPDSSVILITGYASIEIEEMIQTDLPDVQLQIKPLDVDKIQFKCHD